MSNAKSNVLVIYIYIYIYIDETFIYMFQKQIC